MLTIHDNNNKNQTQKQTEESITNNVALKDGGCATPVSTVPETAVVQSLSKLSQPCSSWWTRCLQLWRSLTSVSSPKTAVQSSLKQKQSKTAFVK